ncbi:hypothetical protein ACNKHU_12670 [Shigella flexneri]
MVWGEVATVADCGPGCAQRRDDQRQTGSSGDSASSRKQLLSRTVDSIRAKYPELQETVPAAIICKLLGLLPHHFAPRWKKSSKRLLLVALVILVVF